jgi:hypothetical protein
LGIGSQPGDFPHQNRTVRIPAGFARNEVDALRVHDRIFARIFAAPSEMVARDLTQSLGR